MRKEDVILSLILIGCPVALLATGLLIRPAYTILEYHIDLFRTCLSLTLTALQACGWLIFVKKSRLGSVAKILLCGYVVLFSIFAFLFIWTIMGFEDIV